MRRLIGGSTFASKYTVVHKATFRDVAQHLKLGGGGGVSEDST